MKDTKDFYIENYSTLKKELEGDISIWQDIPCTWVGRTDTVKLAILSKLLYRLNTSSIKILVTYLTELEKTKIHLKPEKTQTNKNNSGKQRQNSRLTILELKLYHKATVIKTGHTGKKQIQRSMEHIKRCRHNPRHTEPPYL